MLRRFPALLLTGFFSLTIFMWSCSKLDTTTIGSDLLPAVDNVHTFDTLLTVLTTQGTFNDTTIVDRFYDQALGVISNDPLFGRTKADLFFQAKPNFYPFYYGNPNDTITGPGAGTTVGFDSIVLCLKYKGFWGDSAVPIHLELRQVVDNQFRDSVYIQKNINYAPFYGGPILGSVDVDVRTLGKYVKFTNRRDSVNNQIRIKITDVAWRNLFFGRDSIKTNTTNNAFYSDSAFRRLYNGLAVIASGGGNGLIYVNLADTGTKLEVHYRKRNNNITDTAYTSLRVNTNLGLNGPPPSNVADHIVRTRAGFPVSVPSPDYMYLQTESGTYVNMSIPALATLSNRVIHRAEIIVEQVPDNPIYDGFFSVPNFLYVDLKDTGTTPKWKPIYIDLNPNQLYDPDYKSGFPYYPTGGVDYQYFGGYRRDKTVLGVPIKYYNFNVTRYVQQLVTKHTYNYDMRLYAPFHLFYSQHSTSYIPFSNNIAYGRVRVGSGSNPNYKLRLRLIYSKL